MLKQTVSLSTVFHSIQAGNNGYVFSSNLSKEYVRRADQLVERGLVAKGHILNSYNKVEIAYFTEKSFKIHADYIIKNKVS